MDTNVLIRTLQPRNAQLAIARAAIKTLTAQGRQLFLTPQNLVEMWAVATRSPGENGLGLTIEETAAELTRLKSLFTIPPETPAIYPLWELLVTQHRVIGKTTHDARLVAAMKVYGLTAILTFNTADFTRYSGIEVMHPSQVTASA